MKKLIFLLLAFAALTTHAQVKVSDLPAAGSMTGTELVPVVQSGVTKKATAQNIASLAIDTATKLASIKRLADSTAVLRTLISAGGTDTTGFGLATRKMLVDTAAALRSAIGTGGGGGGSGTVTSVAIAVPSGLSVSGSPITTSGTITISAPGNASTQYLNGAGGASLVANLPVSSATQTALDLKANIASPTFTGTVGGITKSMVGLSNVPNTDATARANHIGSQTASTISDFNATARGAISLTVTGSGAATYNSSTGVLNVPTPAGGGGSTDSVSMASKYYADTAIAYRSGLVFNARNYGANPNDTLDDAAAINAALVDIRNRHGGKLIMPAPRNNFGYHYLAKTPLITSMDGVNPNAQIVFPLCVMSDTMITIEIEGEYFPNLSSEGIAGANRTNTGVIIESTIYPTTATDTPAVFGTTHYSAGVTGERNYAQFRMSNIIVRTKTAINGVDTIGLMSGINMARALKFETDNVKVDISSKLVDSKEPSAAKHTCGIIYPDVNNQALNGGHGTVMAEGYYTGIVLGEHCRFDRLAVIGCVDALYAPSGFHAATIDHLNVEANVNNIRLEGTGTLNIFTYDTEHYTVGDKWYTHQKDIKYISGGSRVNITNSAVTISNVGRADTAFHSDCNTCYSIASDQNRQPIVEGGNYPINGFGLNIGSKSAAPLNLISADTRIVTLKQGAWNMMGLNVTPSYPFHWNDGSCTIAMAKGTGGVSPTLWINDNNAAGNLAFLVSSGYPCVSWDENKPLLFLHEPTSDYPNSTGGGTIAGAFFGSGNLKIGATTTDQGSRLQIEGAVFLKNQSAPATPTGGGVIYVESGSLKYKGSSGTVTVLGAP